jgi:hypothetical protein
MAKISTYPSASPVTVSDRLLGTDASDNNATKNFIVGDLLGLSIAYLQAFSLVTQQQTTINTARLVEFETGSFSDIINLTSNLITFNDTGKYMISISVKAEHLGGGGDAQLSFWLKYAGSANVPNSRQIFNLTNLDVKEFTYNFMVSVGNPADTYALYWSTTNLVGRLTSTFATGIWPTAPSAILNVFKIA